MGKKKMKLPFLFKNKEEAKQHHPWQWPSCKHPKTHSFRASAGSSHGEDIFKTVNSVFLDPTDGLETTQPETCFTNSGGGEDKTTTNLSSSDGKSNGQESLEETVIRRVVMQSERRLFFEAGDYTSSILEEAKKTAAGGGVGFPFKESLVLEMETEDPYADFRRSMEEMVESHDGLKDWESLEELLGLYLRVNGKKNHGFIVRAFVDLLVTLSSSSSTTTTTTTTTTTSSSSTSSNNNSNCSDSTSYSSAVSSFSYLSSPLSSKEERMIGN